MFPELIALLEGRLEILANLKKARVNDGDQLGHLFHLSLVVACWTLSHMIAIALSAEEANEARHSSLVVIKD